MNAVNRSAYWDNWKGLAIIAVVVIHACGDTKNFPANSFNWLFGLEFRQVVNFAVAMFFAIAGYFAAGAAQKNPVDYYRKRLGRILTPYVIWTAIYLLIRTPLTPPSLDEIAKGYLLGSGIGIGYFVIVLLQFVVLTPLFQRIEKIKAHVLIICLFSLIGLAFNYYFGTQHPTSFLGRFPGSGLWFFVWYPFYHFGYLAARYKSEFRIEAIRPQFVFAALAIALALAFIEGWFWGQQDLYSFGATQVKASSKATSLLLFVTAIVLAGTGTWLDKDSFLTWLGKNSYAIYLIHLLTLGAAKSALRHAEAAYDFQPLFIIASTTLSILGCVIFIRLCKKVLPVQIQQKLLG